MFFKAPYILLEARTRVAVEDKLGLERHVQYARPRWRMSAEPDTKTVSIYWSVLFARKGTQLSGAAQTWPLARLPARTRVSESSRLTSTTASTIIAVTDDMFVLNSALRPISNARMKGKEAAPFCKNARSRKYASLSRSLREPRYTNSATRERGGLFRTLKRVLRSRVTSASAFEHASSTRLTCKIQRNFQRSRALASWLRIRNRFRL